MAWVLRLVETGSDGQARGLDVMEISRPDNLRDVVDLGLTLCEAKQILARVQQAVVAAQARGHAALRPDCSACGGRCHVKDWRSRRVATPFGEVTARLPRFLCPDCGRRETGVSWPSHCRSTPELDRLQTQLSALMTYRVAAGVLAHLLPVAVETSHETLRGHTLKAGKRLRDPAAAKPDATAAVAASAVALSLDSTFVRSCHEGERHLEVRVGDAETPEGGRQVFGAVAESGTDVAALIRRTLDSVGRTGDTELTAFTDGCPGLRSIWPTPVSRARRSWTGSIFPCASGTPSKRRPAYRPPRRIRDRQRRRSPPRSSACAGGRGTARPKIPGSPSSASARSCLPLRASPLAS